MCGWDNQRRSFVDIKRFDWVKGALEGFEGTLAVPTSRSSAMNEAEFRVRRC